MGIKLNWGRLVMANFMYKFEAAMLKYYLWVCLRIFPADIFIWMSKLHKDYPQNADGHYPMN
jgi:hypothetical protein